MHYIFGIDAVGLYSVCLHHIISVEHVSLLPPETGHSTPPGPSNTGNDGALAAVS